jgi:hypothetical protein
MVRLSGTNECGGVEDKRRIRAFVAAQALSIQPYFRYVIHLVEAEQISAVRIRMGLGLERPQIPRHAVVCGKGLLNNGWNSGGMGIWLSCMKPTLLAADIFCIGKDRPFAI